MARVITGTGRTRASDLRTLGRAGAGAILLAVSALGACSSSSPVERRGLGTMPGSGEGWELVMSPVESGEPGAERSRLDGSLASRGGDRAYPLDLYPTSERSLDRARWLYVPSTPGNWLYFSERDGTRSYR